MSPAFSRSDPPTVRELLEVLGDRLGLEVVAGAGGLGGVLSSSRIEKPGLALTGVAGDAEAGRLQVLGRGEISYLGKARKTLDAALERVFGRNTPAVIVAMGLEPPRIVVESAEARGVPLLRSNRETGEVLEQLHQYTAVRLAPRVKIHGVLVDIFGLGVLMLGDSGIGKSECALELVTRGHRLVADDAVEIRLIEDELIGAPPEISRYILEVRGLGLINARQMFGVSAVRETKSVDLVARLLAFDPRRPYDRLGADEKEWDILGHRLPLREIPVAPGRNLAVLIEIAARQQLLRLRGIDTVSEVQANLAQRLEPPSRAEGKNE